jgi:death-on-curing family protein
MIHDELVCKAWPALTIHDQHRDSNLLASAAGRPFHSAFDQELFPTLVEKGAALFHALIADHPFRDGNKRTAILALHSFLAANGALLLLEPRDMEALALETASYRERGISHDDMLAGIVGKLRPAVVPLRDLSKYPAWKRLIADLGRLVRTHSLNKL